MALNIPMPESSGISLLRGLNTGSSMMSRIMQPVLERERLKQQQNQFVQNLAQQKQEFIQNYAIKKEAEARANSLMPYMIQRYQDTHRTAASEATMKELYNGLVQDALKGGGAPISQPSSLIGGGGGMPPQMRSGQPVSQDGGLPDVNSGQPLAVPPIGGTPQISQSMTGDEHELRAGNTRLAKLDRVAGLVPGIPKPQQHFQNGIVFTTYPSGRMTAQRMEGMQTVSQETPEERKKREIETKIGATQGIEDTKAASKLQTSGRELQSLVNRAQKIQKLLDENPNLTGLVKGGLASLNLSESKKLADFDQTTRKLQADMGRYGSQRGGAQALKWAEKSKPGTYKTVDYNKGMIQSILEDAKNDYDEMAQEYKDRTGKEYPIKFPEMQKTTVGKENVTEENILHTMKVTGLSRDKVMARLKQKGLV